MTIGMLAAQPWVERLGLALLHFLWQGTLIAAIYAAVRGGAPVGRYVLACAALMAMAAAPVLTMVQLRGSVPVSVATTFAAPLSAGAEPVRATSVAIPIDTGRTGPMPFLPWAVAFWLLGATAFSLRLLGGCMLAESTRFRMVRAAPADWQDTLNRLRARMSVARPVRLLVSGLVQAPAAIGWLRPVVLVPVGALCGLPPDQMEALLIHELAHIRRHDYLVNILQSAMEALFFYHPGVWWISGHMRAERELCCDDIAVRFTGNAVAYARALAELDTLQPAVMTMAANGGSLAHRIARLLGQPAPARHRALTGRGIAGVATLVGIAALAAFGQPAARPQFEVASVKPSASQRIMAVRPLPGRLTADSTVEILMQYAYHVYRIVGGPAWIQSDRYQIDAKADGAATRADVFLMLQSLLEDRFQLKTHRETKTLPVYALVAAKNGFKLPPATEGGCVNSAADAPDDWTGTGRMAPPGQDQPGMPKCGSAFLSLQPTGPRVLGKQVGMPELARMLSMLLGRSVIDKSGFTDIFDLKLDFVADENTPTMPPPPPGSGLSGPSIMQAIQQQLGLRLESTTGPVDVMVVDSAVRPTAN